MIKGYKEIIAEIDIHTYIKESAEESLKYYQKIMERWKPKELGAMVYSDMPKGGSIDLDPCMVFSKSVLYINRIQEEEEILDKLISSKKALDKLVENKNTKERIKILESIGWKQKQISEFLDISDRHVRRVIHDLRE